MTQENQVIATIKRLGGIATLRDVYTEEVLRQDTREWRTQTPNATIRRICQKSKGISKLKPGLYCLAKLKGKFQDLAVKPEKSEKARTSQHSYFQGLLAELGRMRNLKSYVPPQDKNNIFIHPRKLKDVCSFEKLPPFSYPQIVDCARTIDAIWFSEHLEDCPMPTCLYEVEISTNIEHSLVKFCNLTDFNVKMFIVADEQRERQFHRIMKNRAFLDIKNRVKFMDFERLAKLHAAAT